MGTVLRTTDGGLAVSDPVDGRFRVLSTRDGGRPRQSALPQDLPPAVGWRPIRVRWRCPACPTGRSSGTGAEPHRPPACTDAARR
ncbi:hypothetical protein NUG22_22145, partial [Saccharothrix longispora]|nr:hypothetical protein [Saccharothrix longispora]